jgi:hypothetical protein
MKKMFILWVAVLVSLCAVPSFAAQIRVFVSEMNATGVQNRDEMKQTLQTLLASRLNGDAVASVGSVSEADAVVSGTYIVIGKNFSIDAVAKDRAGKTISRAFVQGGSQDDLIPAMGKLADKLSAELLKVSAGDKSVANAVTTSAAVTPAAVGGGHEHQIQHAPTGEFIKPREQDKSSGATWQSKRLDGAANLIATGLILPDGAREIFLADDQRLSYYRQSADMKLVAEAELKSADKILSLDTIEGNDGAIDIYVTIIRFGELASQVWQVKGEKLVQVAANLPYYFRTISLSGEAKKLYAQDMGRDDDFYGDVLEVSRSGNRIIVNKRIKMPRYGNIYSFNQFRDSDGKTLMMVINPDNYLIVYGQELNELWRSNDIFGGSELYFQKEDAANVRISGDKYRWIFMNQRIQVSKNGQILVGKNDGFWVLGNARSYKRGAVYCLAWNGSSLEEKWRTRETQNYMPDYYFDDARNELLMLQTVQRPSVASRGASSLSIKKVE